MIEGFPLKTVGRRLLTRCLPFRLGPLRRRCVRIGALAALGFAVTAMAGCASGTESRTGLSSPATPAPNAACGALSGSPLYAGIPSTESPIVLAGQSGALDSGLEVGLLWLTLRPSGAGRERPDVRTVVPVSVSPKARIGLGSKYLAGPDHDVTVTAASNTSTLDALSVAVSPSSAGRSANPSTKALATGHVGSDPPPQALGDSKGTIRVVGTLDEASMRDDASMRLSLWCARRESGLGYYRVLDIIARPAMSSSVSTLIGRRVAVDLLSTQSLELLDIRPAVTAAD